MFKTIRILRISCFIVTISLTLVGCADFSCNQEVSSPVGPPQVDEFPLSNDQTETTTLNVPESSAVAYLTHCTGKCWVGNQEDGELLMPGTRLVSQARLQVSDGYADLLFPDIGVIRIQPKTMVDISWEGSVPSVKLTQGELQIVVRGERTEVMRVSTPRLQMELRFEIGAIINSHVDGDEMAVGWGDAKVHVAGRPSFINNGEILLITGEPGEVITPVLQSERWKKKIEQLTTIIHVDEFLPEPAAAAPPAPDPVTAPRPRRGALRVRRISSQGNELSGSCRIYDQYQQNDIFGTTFAFPREMPVRLDTGTYSVRLVYTDIIYPWLGNIEVVGGETSEAVFSGFGRLQLVRQNAETVLPLFFRIYRTAPKEGITRHALELTEAGIELELLPGAYIIEFVYVDNAQVPPQEFVITAGETTIREISF